MTRKALFVGVNTYEDEQIGDYAAAGLTGCMGIGGAIAIIVKGVRHNRSAEEIKE